MRKVIVLIAVFVAFSSLIVAQTKEQELPYGVECYSDELFIAIGDSLVIINSTDQEAESATIKVLSNFCELKLVKSTPTWNWYEVKTNSQGMQSKREYIRAKEN